jgi:hypothetical protein
MNRVNRTEHLTGNQNSSKDEALQVVTYDNSRRGHLYIDSDDKQDGTYQNAIYGNRNKLINHNIHSIGTKELNILYKIPNINESNNKIVYIFNTGGLTVRTATLTIGNYTTIADLYTEIVIQMNLVNGAEGTFSTSTLTDTSITLLSTVDFKIISCTAVNNSECTGLFYTGFTPSMVLIPTLQYTKYIDFIISELKQSQITRDTFTKSKTFNEKDHIARIFINEELIIPRIIDKEYEVISYFPFIHRDLEQFQIYLYTDKAVLINSNIQTIDSIDYEVRELEYNISFSVMS